MVIDNYSFFKYIPKESKVHMMNSKMKVAWFLLSILVSLVILDYFSLLVFSLFVIYITSKTKIEFDVYASNVLILWPIYCVVFLISFLITFDLLLSFLVVFKLMLIVILFLILTFTTSLSEIAWGFECLFAPLKKVGFPVSNTSLFIALSIKFFSNLFDQAREVRKSMAYRGIPYKKNKILSLKKMAIPIIRLSYKLSLRTIAAMKLRFYGYGKKRTNYHENKVTKFDKSLMLMDTILLYVVIWMGWMR